MAAKLLTPDAIVAELERRAWIVSHAARALGVSRQALYAALRRHGIAIPDRTEALHDYLRRVGRRGGRPRKDADAA